MESFLQDIAFSKVFAFHSSNLKPAAFLSQAAERECKGSPCDMTEAARYYFLFKILGTALNEKQISLPEFKKQFLTTYQPWNFFLCQSEVSSKQKMSNSCTKFQHVGQKGDFV